MIEIGDPRLPEWFWAKVTVAENGCWMYSAVGSNRYGYVLTEGRSIGAHRYAYVRLVGPIPEGLVTDHICHNADPTCPGSYSCDHKACVRPDHLELTTSAENLRRAARQRRAYVAEHGPMPWRRLFA